MVPDAFAHLALGPHDSRVTRAIFRVERSLRQAVPNITLKIDPAVTPDDLIDDAVRTVFETGKPHFVNHPMMVADHGERYAAVSCYNSLKIGGGAHTLVRLNLEEAALRHYGTSEQFLTIALPYWVELTAELAEARVRSLVEEQRFFDTHWLATEGLIDINRFTAMFGIYGLAECVNHLMVLDDNDRDGEARYGHDADADALSVRVVERVAELVAARPMPYCEGGARRCSLHSQGDMALDDRARHGSDQLAAGSENAYQLTQRTTQRVGCHERVPR